MNTKSGTAVQGASEAAEDRYNVPALERGLALLGEFTRNTRTLTAPELARRTGFPRSTVFRLLTTLENLGYVERDAGGRDYRLGLAVLRLGFEYLASLQLNELGQPLLNQLSKSTGYACHLTVRDGRDVVYVARVAPASPFVSAVSVGTRLPVHATVLGRIMLFDQSLEDLKTLYPEDSLQPFAVGTPRTVEQLFRLVREDHLRGYAVSEGFFELNISTIAAPVRNHTGHVVAALGLTVNASRIEQAEHDGLIQQVCGVAGELSSLFNYAPAA